MVRKPLGIGAVVCVLSTGLPAISACAGIIQHVLLISVDGMHASLSVPVVTGQIGPTILAVLGLDPNSLQAVVQEGTPILPGILF